MLVGPRIPSCQIVGIDILDVVVVRSAAEDGIGIRSYRVVDIAGTLVRIFHLYVCCKVRKDKDLHEDAPCDSCLHVPVESRQVGGVESQPCPYVQVPLRVYACRVCILLDGLHDLFVSILDGL